MNISNLAQKATQAHAAGQPHVSLLHRLGIQPMVAIIFVMVDWLLFGGEVFTGMASLPISITVGIILGLWAMRRQYVSYKDSLGISIVKGILLGALTAIPSPMGSIFTLIGGLLPLVDKITGKATTDGEPADRSNKADTPEMRNVTPQKSPVDHE